jgi:hypothetical protein
MMMQTDFASLRSKPVKLLSEQWFDTIEETSLLTGRLKQQLHCAGALARVAQFSKCDCAAPKKSDATSDFNKRWLEVPPNL